MRYKQGSTFIETLLYTALVGVILGSIAVLASATFTVQAKIRAATIVEQQVRFSMARITSIVSQASAITTPAAGTSSSTLIVSMPNAFEDPTTIRLTNGTIYLTQGATGTAQAITSNEVALSNLHFTRVSSTAPMIQVQATAGMVGTPVGYATITVTSTIAVRR